MATRKSPSRGTGSRPAKATAAIGKSRAAKKPLKVSAKATAPEVESEAESNVVPMTAAEPAPVVEETVEAPAAPVEPPVVEDVAEVEASAPETAPEIDEPAEDAMSTDETIEETKVEAAWPFGFSPATFPGFPQMPNFGDFSKFATPNFGAPNFGAMDMNAFVTSSTALAEGMRSLGEEMMAFSQKSAQRNVETAMAVLGASSIEEAVDLQSRFVTGSVDEMMSESAKLTGMAIEVANKAAAPFTRF